VGAPDAGERDGIEMEVVRDLSGIVTRWRCWYLLSTQDIGLRYKRSVLGPFWISLSIAAFILGLATIYAELFDAPFQDYINRLATGYVLWHYLAAMINDGAHTATEAASKVKYVQLPLSVLAARVVARNLIILAHNLAATIPILLIFGGHGFNEALLWAPLGLLIYATLGIFVAMTLGPISARFRDIPEVLKSVTQLCFFLTPVLWPADRLAASSFLLDYNPFYHLIELLRAPLLGHPPTTENLLVSVSCVAVFFVTSIWSVHAAHRRLALWV
jgi:ABC-type polysaccharide/polyol phosphate export permease